MSRTWLTERVKDIEDASKRYEAIEPPVTDCKEFLRAFESQLHNQLHLKNISPLVLPIKKGCYSKVEELMKTNQIQVASKPTYPCDCSIMFLLNNKLHFAPTIPEVCLREKNKLEFLFMNQYLK